MKIHKPLFHRSKIEYEDGYEVPYFTLVPTFQAFWDSVGKTLYTCVELSFLLWTLSLPVNWKRKQNNKQK